MKKLSVSAALLLALCIVLTACGAPSPAPGYVEPEGTAALRPTATPQPTATPEPADTPEKPTEASHAPTETEAPTTAEVPAESDAVARYMDTMTLREKVGQLFFIRPDALDPAQTPG